MTPPPPAAPTEQGHSGTSAFARLAARVAANPSLAGYASMSAKLANAVIALAANVFAARLLGAEGFGIYAFSVTIAVTLAVLAALGMPFAAIRHIPEYLAGGKHGLARGFRRASLAASFMGGAICAAALLLLARFFEGSGGMETALFWAAGMVLPFTLCQTIASMMQAEGFVVGPELMQGALRQTLTLGFLALAWLASDGGLLAVTLALAATTLANVAAAVGLFVLLGRLTSTGGEAAAQPPEYALRRWLRTGGGVLAIVLCAALNERVDILMLGWLVSPDQLGHYAAATRVASVAILALAGLNAAFMPRISRAYAAGDYVQVERLCRKAMVSGLVVTTLMLAGAAVTGQFLLSIFGAGFVDAWPALILLICAQIGVAIGGPAGGLAVIAGHDRMAFGVVVAGIAGNVVLNLILTQLLGITGAAIATLAAVSLSSLWLGQWCSRKLGLAVMPFNRSTAAGRMPDA